MTSLIAALSLVASFAVGCESVRPAPGAIIQSFSPVGIYSGHWGTDFATKQGTPVRVMFDGVVSFAGTIAGRRSVTVHHGGGVRTSYSYLTEILVQLGSALEAGATLGTAGLDHGGAVHVSLRVGDRYLDLAQLMSCHVLTEPGNGLRLV